MTRLDDNLKGLIQWSRSLNGFQENWLEILLVEDPLFEFRTKVPKHLLSNIVDYAKRFDNLLDSGYSWINLNIGGVYQSKLIIFVEYPRKSSDCPKGKTSINYSGPKSDKWDLTVKFLITENTTKQD